MSEPAGQLPDFAAQLPDASGEAPPPYAPLLSVALCFMAGIWVARHVGLSVWLCAAATMAAAVGLGLACWRWRWGAGGRTVLAGLVALLAGGSVMSQYLTPAADDIGLLADRQQPRIVRLHGQLLESPRSQRRPDNPLLLFLGPPETSSLLLEVRGIDLPGSGRRRASGRVRLRIDAPLPGQPDDRPRTGDLVSATVLLGQSSPALNPGQVDMPTVNRLNGISAIASTTDWQTVRWQRPAGWDFRGWIGTIRHRWQAALSTDGPRGEADLLAALVLGDREELSDDRQEAFTRAGVMHYLAVSGLHVALAAGMIILVLRWLMVGPRLRALLVIGFVICYCLATELRPSVMRAAVFLILVSLAWLSGRRSHLLNTLAAAAIIVLAFRPGDLFQPGFQLSFVVVFGLIIGTRRVKERLFGRRLYEQYSDCGALRRLLRKVRHGVEELAAVSVTAWCFSAPLVALHFGQISPVGIFATLLVFVPTLALLLVGIASVIVSQVALPAGQAVAELGRWPARLLVWLVEWLADLPIAAVDLPPVGWPLVIIALMLLIGWTLRRQLRLGRVQFVAAGLVAALFVLLTLPRGPAEDVHITVLAVGNGDTVVVQGPGGYNLLVDCGSSLFAERTGESVTLPALRELGVRRLSGVLLTHADADHIKDLAPVLARIPTERLYISTHFAGAGRYDDRLLDFLREQGIVVQTVAAGDRLPTPQGMVVEVLHPAIDLPSGAEDNQASVVLRVERSGGGSMLLPGDAPGRVLRQLSQAGCRVDAVLLPHHGEQGTEAAAAVAELGAGVAVISAAEKRDRNRPGTHPWPQGVAVYRTWRDGAVRIELAVDGIRPVPFVVEKP